MPERRASGPVSRPVALGVALLGPALVGLAGCGSGAQSASATPTGPSSFLDAVRASSPAKELRFRPVLAVAETVSSGAPLSEQDRQSTDPAVQQRALESFNCGTGRPDPLAGADDAALPLVACAESSGSRYLLGPAALDGSAVKSAGLSHAPGNAVFTVDVTFTPDASARWAELTAKNAGKSIAIVVGAQVMAVPSVFRAVPAGKAEIPGWSSQSDAEDIADWLNGH